MFSSLTIHALSLSLSLSRFSGRRKLTSNRLEKVRRRISRIMPARLLFLIPLGFIVSVLLIFGGTITVQVQVPIPAGFIDSLPRAITGRRAAVGTLLQATPANSRSTVPKVLRFSTDAAPTVRSMNTQPPRAHPELTHLHYGDSSLLQSLPAAIATDARPQCPKSNTKLFLLPRPPVISESMGSEEEPVPQQFPEHGVEQSIQAPKVHDAHQTRCTNDVVRTSFIPDECPLVPNPVHPKSFVAHLNGRAEKDVHPGQSSMALHARSLAATIQPLCSAGASGHASQTIVELGAGAGALLSLLVPENSTHFGIGTDVSLAQVEWGRKYFPHLMLEQSNGAPFVRDGAATCAVSTSTLMYVDADDACEHIGEALRLLAPGGVAVLWGLPRAKPKLGGWTRYSASFFVNASSGEVLPYCAHLGRLTSAVEIYEDNEPGSAFRWPYFFGVRLERNAVPLHCNYPGNSTNVRIPDPGVATAGTPDWSSKLAL
jgi:hypothetical protein